jgi:hypothetical protein
LTGVREARDDGGNTAGGSGFAGVDHDEELHKVVVDLTATTLNNEDIFITDCFVRS